MRYKLAQVILAVSVISQPTLYQANAQSPPAGSYTKNCGRMAVNGPLLTAVCTSDGRMGPVQVWPMFSLVGYSRCIGDIAFVNGKLSCNLPPPPEGTLEQSNVVQYQAPVNITFPTQFGGTPNITLSWFHFCGGSSCRKWKPIPYTAIVSADPIVTTRGFTLTGPQGWWPVAWAAVGPALGHAQLTAKYLILSIIYAPPGGPKGTNMIDYQHSNTQGTSTSISHSFNQDYSISFEGQGGFFGADAGGGLGFDYSHDVTNKDSLNVEISKTGGLRAQGAETEDGIHNDDDDIILVVNPTIDVRVGTSVLLWSLTANSPPPVRVSVAWLKDPTRFQKDAPGVKSYLEKQGITEKDYPEIWQHDLLAIPSSVPDPKRYEPSSQFQYSPPAPCDSTPVATRVGFERKSTSTTEKTVTDRYQVDVTHFDQFGANAGVDLKGKLTETGKWTWTTSTSNSNATTQVDTISMSVGGPHCGWPGSPLIRAYLDKVYGTYAFREVQGEALSLLRCPRAVHI